MIEKKLILKFKNDLNIGLYKYISNYILDNYLIKIFEFIKDKKQLNELDKKVFINILNLTNNALNKLLELNEFPINSELYLIFKNLNELFLIIKQNIIKFDEKDLEGLKLFLISSIKNMKNTFK